MTSLSDLFVLKKKKPLWLTHMSSSAHSSSSHRNISMFGFILEFSPPCLSIFGCLRSLFVPFSLLVQVFGLCASSWPLTLTQLSDFVQILSSLTCFCDIIVCDSSSTSTQDRKWWPESFVCVSLFSCRLLGLLKARRPRLNASLQIVWVKVYLQDKSISEHKAFI